MLFKDTDQVDSIEIVCVVWKEKGNHSPNFFMLEYSV